VSDQRPDDSSFDSQPAGDATPPGEPSRQTRDTREPGESGPPKLVEQQPAAPSAAPGEERLEPQPQPEPVSPPPPPAAVVADVPPAPVAVGAAAPISSAWAFEQAAPPAPPPISAEQPKRSHSGLKAVVCLVVLAALGGLGWLGYLLYQPYGIRAGARSHIEAAARECRSGRFERGLASALDAERVLAAHPEVFDEITEQTIRVRIADAKRALGVHRKASEAVARAADDFFPALSTLTELISAETDVVDAKSGVLVGDGLLAELRSMLDAMLVAEAARVRDAGLDVATGMERMEALLAELALRDESPAVAAVRGASAEYAAAKLRAEAAATDTALRGVLAKVAANDLAGAMAAVRERSRTARDAHARIADAVEGDLIAKIRTLAAGEIPESLRPDLTELPPAAGPFFELAKTLIDAAAALETALANPNARATLEELGAAAGRLATKLSWGADDSAQRIASYVGELERIDETREGFRKRWSEGDEGGYAAMACVDAARGSPEIRLRGRRVKVEAGGVTAELSVLGARATFEAPKALYRSGMAFTVRGYTFRLPWSHDRLAARMLIASRLSALMDAASVSRALTDEWRIIEGPGFPLALAEDVSDGACFVVACERGAWKSGSLCAVTFDEAWAEAQEDDAREDDTTREFKEAAKALAEKIRSDEEIGLDVRQAMVPVVESSYGKTDPRDLLEPEFCRRIVAEGYLESQVAAIATRHGSELERYRAAARALEGERAIFTLRCPSGLVHTALRSIDTYLEGSEGAGDGDRDADDPYDIDEWSTRAVARDVTRQTRHLKQGMFYWIQLVTEYGPAFAEGGRRTPLVRTLVHMVEGPIATYTDATGALEADPGRWRAAMTIDLAPGRRESLGEPGWEFPPHVPVFDAEGKTLGLALDTAYLASPSFDDIADPVARVAEQEAFIGECARVMDSPGKLGLFFRYMMQYCHDSPVQSMPKLVGNHVAQGEMHQTANEFLDRKLGGMFTGDCDDIAEFFQAVTRRQGKLSHVFSLPKHAACGYVDVLKTPEGADRYDLVFLQTGPPVIFTGKTLDQAVEKGILHFSEDEAPTFTVASVPFLFRFAGEKVRTQYWLSDRICVDEEYADLLILVQSYWHYHYYATAIRTMEERLATDKDISNYIELSGLYRRVRLYPKAIEMQIQALQAQNRGDEKVRLKETADLAAYYHRLKQDEMAKLVLAEVASTSEAVQKTGKYDELYRLMPVRLEAAGLYCAMKDPVAAFRLVDSDIRMFLGMKGELIEPLRDIALSIALTLRRMMDEGKQLDKTQASIRDRLIGILRDQFDKKVFENDDSFNTQIRNYGDLATLAAAIDGRDAVRAKLLQDGPYPTAPRAAPRTGRELTDDDWAWIRICPFVYSAYISELTQSAQDEEDGVRYYDGPRDPATAERLADAMVRGVEAGRKLGSMSMFDDAILQVDLLRAILKKDVAAFAAVLARTAASANDRHMQRMAIEFGRSAESIPLADLDLWMDTFRERIPGKQYPFHIAHTALANDFAEHAFAAADRAVEVYPDEPMMAVEAKYMRELAAQLAETDAEVERQKQIREEWRPLNDETLAVARAGKFDDALAIGAKAIAVAEKLGPGHCELMLSLELVTEIEAIDGRFDVSTAHLRRAVEIWRGLGYVSFEARAAFLGRAARTFAKAGRAADAEAIYAVAVEAARTARGEGSVYLANALYAQADFLTSTGEHARAVGLLRSVLAIDEKLYGDAHSEVAFDLGKLAAALAAVGQHGEAEGLYVRAVGITEGLQGGETRLPALLVELAAARKASGMFDEAEGDLTRAREIYARQKGAESAEVAEVTIVLGELSAARGDAEKTRAYFGRALSMVSKLDSPDDAVRSAVNRYASALWRLKAYGEAEQQYLRLLEIDTRTLGAESRQVGVDLWTLGDLMRDAGEHAKAGSYHSRAAEIIKKHDGEESPD
jgi:tetratricopeptide (TPR) repeat protein